jgi:hypothetical protein
MVDAKSRYCCNCLYVILNEVKDHFEVRDVSVKSYSWILILHFVQDDNQNTPVPPYMCCI